jgi:hypothetical protein
VYLEVLFPAHPHKHEHVENKQWCTTWTNKPSQDSAIFKQMVFDTILPQPPDEDEDDICEAKDVALF